MRKLVTFWCVALWILPIGSVHAADDPDDIYWDNSISPDNVSGLAGPVYALTVFDGKLIAGGEFTTAGGTTVNNIAAWNGTSWSALGSGMNGGSGSASVSALIVYDGKLIAGGDFTTAGGVAASQIAAWDGTSWSALGSGMDGSVHALTIYDGKLTAGGSFTMAGGVAASQLAAWDGGNWSALGSAPGGWPLAVHDGKLVVVGYDGVSAWDGTSWSLLLTCFGTINSMCYVTALTAFEGQLIAFKVDEFGLSITHAIWASDGVSWSELGSGIDGDVFALTVYDGKLVVGDYGVLALDGSSWSGLGSGTNGTIYALTVFEGSLIAGGQFTSAGGKAAASLARWNKCPLMTGNVNTGGVITSADIIYLVHHVFKSGPEPLPCAAAGDVDCSGSLSSADIIGLVNFVFKGGAVPCNACTIIPGRWTCP